MALGEAFVEVHADLRPFIRDLDGQLRQATSNFERQFNGAINRTLRNSTRGFGDSFGEELGNGFERSFSRRFGSESSSTFLSIASALGSALDNGISSLPAEVKAAIVAGLLLALPVIGALLVGAITGALALGIVGIGVALGSQFEQVQSRAVEFGRAIRQVLVSAADAFGPAIISALDMIEGVIVRLAPTINEIFDITAEFLGPLTAGLLIAFEKIVESIRQVAPKLQPFVDALVEGFILLGDTIAVVFRALVASGDDGANSLRLLFHLARALILAFTGVLLIFTKLLGLVRQLARVADTVTPLLRFIGILGDVQEGETSVIATNSELEDSFNGVIEATKGEEKELKDVTAALDGYSDAAFRSIEVDLEFEESLDRIADSLKENGKLLDDDKEKGRENIRSFLDGLKAAEDRALHRLQVQGYTTEQAVALYNQEIAQIKELALRAGITEQQFNDLFGEIVAVSGLKISSSEMGIDDVEQALQDAVDQARALQGIMSVLNGATGGSLSPGQGRRGYADGDIINRPTFGLVGEAGPEVIIPLTKPARAAQLARQSGLTAILGGDGTQVLVFIGSEQLEARMVKVVERNNKTQALSLNQGPRRF